MAGGQGGHALPGLPGPVHLVAAQTPLPVGFLMPCPKNIKQQRSFIFFSLTHDIILSEGFRMYNP